MRAEIPISSENPISIEIRAKLSQIPSRYKRRSVDNRRVMARLTTSIIAMEGLFESLGGKLPRGTHDVASVNLSADNDGTTIASISVDSGFIDEPSSIWNAVIKPDGKENWSFTRGEESSPLEHTVLSSLALRQIIDHAQHEERNVEHYGRVLNKWANLGKWSDDDRREALSALMMAEYHNGGVPRKSGEDYVEHVFQTARQAREWLIEASKDPEFKLLRSLIPNAVKISLGHDVAEDSPYLRPRRNEKYDNWNNRIYRALRSSVGAFSARGIMLMTKPPVEVEPEKGEKFTVMFDESTPMTKELSRSIYYKSIESADPLIIMIKLADRLHNIRTLWAMPLESQIDTILETEEVYLRMLDLLPPKVAKIIRRDFEREIAKYKSILPVQVK